MGQAQQATLSGKINGGMGTIRVEFINPNTGKVESYGSQISGVGDFEIIAPLQSPIVATLYYGDNNSDFIWQPNDNLSISATTSAFVTSLRFQGNNNEANNFIAQFKTQYDLPLAAKIPRNAPLAEFRRRADEMRTQKKNAVTQFMEKYPAPSLFYDYMSGRIDVDWANRLFEYPFLYALNNFEVEINNIPDSYYDFVYSVDINNRAAMHLPVYNKLLVEYLNYRFRKEKPRNTYDYEARYTEKYNFIRQNLSGRAMWIALADCLTEGSKNGKVEYLGSQYADFIAQNPYPELSTTVNAAYGTASRISRGMPAPNVLLQTVSSTNTSLSQFRGKVVYLDFWASWCAPCMAEVPFMKDLQHNFADENIAFVFISVDENPNQWLSAINKYPAGTNGTHLNITGVKSDEGQAFGLTGVPRYMILDRNGNILNSNANAPSSEGIISQLKQALNTY